MSELTQKGAAAILDHMLGVSTWGDGGSLLTTYYENGGIGLVGTGTAPTWNGVTDGGASWDSDNATASNGALGIVLAQAYTHAVLVDSAGDPILADPQVGSVSSSVTFSAGSLTATIAYDNTPATGVIALGTLGARAVLFEILFGGNTLLNGATTWDVDILAANGTTVLESYAGVDFSSLVKTSSATEVYYSNPSDISLTASTAGLATPTYVGLKPSTEGLTGYYFIYQLTDTSTITAGSSVKFAAGDLRFGFSTIF